MTANLSNIGIKIKQLREHANLTQSQVAEYLSVDQSLISKFEKGERSVSSDILNQLSVLFCCPISAFMSDGQIAPAYNIAFRTDSLDNTDLTALSVIHKLALNQLKMDQLAGGIANDR
ncbi:MAG: helix-turn-helix transcriptional regulator [Lachnospiraceae bacterium]|nr:helix-turn-helix transcriptional regulator [Lachnospiraceae bacterium]